MKRLIRRMLYLLAFAFLFAAVGLPIACHFSSDWNDQGHEIGNWEIGAAVSHGQIGLWWTHFWTHIIRGPKLAGGDWAASNKIIRSWFKHNPPLIDWYNRLILLRIGPFPRVSTNECDLGGTSVQIGAAIWLVEVLLLLVALSALLWARRLRHRPEVIGPPRCLACGYDLRATPESCPECGTLSQPVSPSVGPASQKKVAPR